MFKKALQVVTTFGVLLACYAGYVRLFAIIAAEVGSAAPPIPFAPRKESTTQLEAIRTAADALGPTHWSADRALPIRYYNHERGYWMYAKEAERRPDGKQLTFKPFAIVWKSRDGRALKTATSDMAVVDLDQPVLSLSNTKSNEPMKVVHAQLEGNVQLRDDKGTRESTIDDLVIGPMPYVEFDEPSLQIKSRSDIMIQDRDMRITGFDLLIQLRPKNEGAPGSIAGGFDAKSASLEKNVHIVLNDVGQSGILPGKAKDGPGPGAGAGAGPEEQRTPLDLRCAGKMRVELPPTRRPVLIGPPAPPLPTMLYFNRDVVVRRGKPGEIPDQLDCDDLRLTMQPKAKGGAKPKPTSVTVATADGAGNGNENGPGDSAEPPPSATGAGTEMTLREAKATGHAVWLQSKSQGITALCNELIHRKLAPDRADETYLRGDSKSKLQIEKVEIASEGPNKGKPKSYTTIRTIDATIFDDGQGSENATIVARGPGLLETRSSRDKPVERKAIWQDHLVMKTDFDVNNQPTKYVNLTGRPEFIDVAQASLDAEKEIRVWLAPKAKPAEAPAPKASPRSNTQTAGGQKGADSFQIQRLEAMGNVHLIAPGKVMNARDNLVTIFENPAPSPAGAGAQPVPAPAGTAPPQQGGLETSPSRPAPNSAPQETDKEQGKDPKKPTEPEVSVTADTVWAVIQLKPADPNAPARAETETDTAGLSKGEVQQVRLRGGVVFHQDPEPGKSQGTDVTGQALDVFNQGEGKMKFVVQHHIAPEKATAAELALTPNARVATEEMTITGPNIGLDQKDDHAWVKGPGTLTQLASRGLLTEKGLGDDNKEPGARQKQGQGRDKTNDETSKRPLTISWKHRMSFVGRPSQSDPESPTVAIAQFYHGVRAVMEDAQLSCQERLDVYMDRPVSLARPKGANKEVAPGEEPEARPQIALLDCFSDVVVELRKTDPGSKLLLQKQRIEGGRVTYDKVTGNFHVPGQGKVFLWNREDGAENPLAVPAMPGSAPAGAGPRIKPAANPAAPPPTRRATSVIGSNGSQIPPGRVGAEAAAAARRKVTVPPLKLTVITFEREMIGRFVVGKDKDTTETRWARFLGDVQALNATVGSENTPIDFDRPPDDYMLLTAQKLDVSSVPTPGKTSAAKNYLMAVSEAQAKTRNETIRADVIKYDSQKELFQAYSEEGRPVAVVRQDGVGQPNSNGRVRAIKYNRKTGESELLDPMSPLELVQAKSGIRFGALPEGKDKKIKTPRNGPGLKIPVRSHTERKGMTGR